MKFDPYHRWLGIPPNEQPPHYYRLLGLARFESDPDVIDNAADQRMAHVRQFQTGEHSDDATRLLNEISAARRELLSAAKIANQPNDIQVQGTGCESPVGILSQPIKEMRVAPPPVIAEVVEEPRKPTPPSNRLERDTELGWLLVAVAAGIVIIMAFSGR